MTKAPSSSARRPRDSTRREPQGSRLYRWRWQGNAASGRRLRGRVVAATRADVEKVLHAQGIVVLRIHRGGRSGATKGRIRSRDVMLFSRQLATLLKAGIPIIQAFEVVAESLNKPAMRALVQDLMSEIASGASLSEALGRYPRQFDSLYVSMIAAGEQSGALDAMLDRLALHQEKREALKSRVRKAMWYPASVLGVGFAVTAILLIKVVPQFEGLFAGFGAELPPLTQLTLSLSGVVQRYWLHALGGVVAATWLGRLWLRRSPHARRLAQRLALKLPVLGKVLDQSAVARFTRTLATAFAAGVPMIEALDTAKGSAGNALYAEAIGNVREHVAGGQQLHFAMRSAERFPALAVQMVGIGEESGMLDAMLHRVADYYEAEVDRRVDTLTTLMEPMIIVVLGVLVGGLVVSMYLPIFQLGGIM